MNIREFHKKDLKDIFDSPYPHYYRINNNHIFIQMTGSDIENILPEIAAKNNQRIHIFEIYPPAIINTLTEVIEMTKPDTKVIIHIPYALRDYARILEKTFENLPKKWKILTEHKDVSFTINDGTDNKKFYVKFTTDDKGYFIRTYNEMNTYHIPRAIYDVNPKAAIRTAPQQDDPDLFKDRIIKNFKRSCSKKILNMFKNDDDIWKYITEPDSWE